MRRSIPAAGITAAALLMLARFHSAPEASGAKLRPAAQAAQRPTTAPPTTATTGGQTAPPTSSAQVTSPGSPGAATGATTHDGTFTGSEIQTRWGPVQVQVVVQGGKLTDVREVEAPNSHDRSVEINNEAAPILRDEALTVQSANIDLVSGATITWDGYRQSLQAALDLAQR